MMSSESTTRSASWPGSMGRAGLREHGVGGVEAPGSNRFMVFDDGHRRKKKNPEANNHGQVWQPDEKARTATLCWTCTPRIASYVVLAARRPRPY